MLYEVITLTVVLIAIFIPETKPEVHPDAPQLYEVAGELLSLVQCLDLGADTHSYNFV